MLNIHSIVRRLGLMLIFAGFGIPAAAAGVDIQWAPKTVKGGFTVKLPSIDNDALVGELAPPQLEPTHDEQLLSRNGTPTTTKKKEYGGAA